MLSHRPRFTTSPSLSPSLLVGAKSTEYILVNLWLERRSSRQMISHHAGNLNIFVKCTKCTFNVLSFCFLFKDITYFWECVQLMVAVEGFVYVTSPELIDVVVGVCACADLPSVRCLLQVVLLVLELSFIFIEI